MYFQLLFTPLWKEKSWCRLSSAPFLYSSAWHLQTPAPPQERNIYLIDFCIALAFPILADADVLALMEPFILLNGEKDFFAHTNWAAIRIIARTGANEGLRFPEGTSFKIFSFPNILFYWAFSCPLPALHREQIDVTLEIAHCFLLLL